MGGHIKEGLELIRSVLAAVGFTLPAGPKRALISLLWKRLRLRLRGLNFTERKASEIPEVGIVPHRYLLGGCGWAGSSRSDSRCGFSKSPVVTGIKGGRALSDRAGSLF